MPAAPNRPRLTQLVGRGDAVLIGPVHGANHVLTLLVLQFSDLIHLILPLPRFSTSPEVPAYIKYILSYFIEISELA